MQTNLDEEPEAVGDEFHNFLAKVISNWTDKRDLYTSTSEIPTLLYT